MKLIVGLGNPGRAYAHTRHNVGFDVVDMLARRRKTKVLGRQCRALVGSFDAGGERVLLAKPQTFMNESGSAVSALVDRYGIRPEDLIVVYDDMDLPPGRIRIRKKGSSGGHRGMNSIIRSLGTTDFPRLRIGIGHGDEAVEHVLSRFSRKELALVRPALERAVDALEMIIKDGIEAAMNVYNREDNAADE